MRGTETVSVTKSHSVAMLLLKRESFFYNKHKNLTLMVNETLTAAVTDETPNLSGLIRTSLLLILLQKMLMLKSTACVWGGRVPGLVALLGESEPSFLCTQPPSTQKSKDALEISFIQARGKRTGAWRTKAGHCDQTWKKHTLFPPTFHWPDHYHLTSSNTSVDGTVVYLDVKVEKEMGWLNTYWAFPYALGKPGYILTEGSTYKVHVFCIL